jgi:lactoylglutathione lyase
MIIKVEHVAVIVNDMNESIRYYCELFGFVLRTRGSNERREMAFLKYEHQPGFEIELIQDLQVQEEYSAKGIVNHIAFTVAEIDEAISIFRKKGVVFATESPNIAIDGAKTIFFTGINGELLQLFQPNLN